MILSVEMLSNQLKSKSDYLNYTSGTNSAGLGPVALRMAVKMSRGVRPVNGWIESKVLPKVSWKM